MQESQASQSSCFTVVCLHYDSSDACNSGERLTVVIEDLHTAEDAAEQACRHVVAARLGWATALFVLRGRHELIPMDGPFVDADFDIADRHGTVIEIS